MRVRLAFVLPMFIPFSISSLMAQPTGARPVFVSVNLGGFVSASDNFSKVYDSRFGFAVGGSVGLPLSSRMYLYGKATYFSKTGVPVVSTYEYDRNGNLVSNTETKDGTAKFKEWIINGGLQYNLFPSEDFTLGITGGISYSKVSEEQRSSAYSISSSVDGTGILGVFGGLGLERNFRESPFTILAEAQYNHSLQKIAGSSNYGGVNLNIGLRYYFGERRRE